VGVVVNDFGKLGEGGRWRRRHFGSLEGAKERQWDKTRGNLGSQGRRKPKERKKGDAKGKGRRENIGAKTLLGLAGGGMV